MTLWTEFVDDLTTVGVVKSASDEAVGQWGKDIPITVLFSAIGKCIALHFESFSTHELTLIFLTIEKGMSSTDITLINYVATGLLESLYLQAVRNGSSWEKIETLLGNRSIAYLNEWRSWQQD